MSLQKKYLENIKSAAERFAAGVADAFGIDRFPIADQDLDHQRTLLLEQMQRLLDAQKRK